MAQQKYIKSEQESEVFGVRECNDWLGALDPLWAEFRLCPPIAIAVMRRHSTDHPLHLHAHRDDAWTASAPQRHRIHPPYSRLLSRRSNTDRAPIVIPCNFLFRKCPACGLPSSEFATLRSSGSLRVVRQKLARREELELTGK